jgi:hypothetical protein
LDFDEFILDPETFTGGYSKVMHAFWWTEGVDVAIKFSTERSGSKEALQNEFHRLWYNFKSNI